MGRFFVSKLEPPVKPSFRGRAPRNIQPRSEPPLGEALESFLISQDEVRAFLRENEGLDLARVSFQNPFLPLIRFSLATGLHAIPAHERRHLWQAWRVRRGAEEIGDKA
jgi:hypothetical protein